MELNQFTIIKTKLLIIFAFLSLLIIYPMNDSYAELIEFQSGDTIIASEINNNFNSLKDDINKLNSANEYRRNVVDYGAYNDGTH